MFQITSVQNSSLFTKHFLPLITHLPPAHLSEPDHPSTCFFFVICALGASAVAGGGGAHVRVLTCLFQKTESNLVGVVSHVKAGPPTQDLGQQCSHPKTHKTNPELTPFLIPPAALQVGAALSKNRQLPAAEC